MTKIHKKWRKCWNIRETFLFKLTWSHQISPTQFVYRSFSVSFFHVLLLSSNKYTFDERRKKKFLIYIKSCNASFAFLLSLFLLIYFRLLWIMKIFSKGIQIAGLVLCWIKKHENFTEKASFKQHKLSVRKVKL